MFIFKKIKIISFIALILFFSIVQAASEKPQNTRPFLMGFTRWPSDLTYEGAKISLDFAHNHGDIVSVMFIGGVPWQEALDDKPFSKDIENNLDYRPPAGKKIFLSLSPLNNDRSGLAPYWGEKDNLPLPDNWKNLEFDSPQVKKAFLAFALRSVERMKPAYLALGIELNILLSKSPEKWQKLKEMYKEIYLAVKKKYPHLPVFFTTEILHYKNLLAEPNDKNQEAEVNDLMQYSDLFAMSIYPHMSYSVPRPVPNVFLDFAKIFNKPIAVSESGITSQDVLIKTFNTTLHGSEKEQQHFTELLLKTALRDNYAFVITYATTDFEKLCDKLPAGIGDFARIWEYTGLQTSDAKPKPALAVWDEYLKYQYKH